MEAMGTGRGFKGWFRGQVMRLALGGVVTVMAVRWLRKLAVGRVLPRPGDGPTERQRREGVFSAHIVGRRGDQTLYLDVIGQGDPGYLATSRMLSQTALALCKDALPDTYGVLTPGGFMGDALLQRLPKVGIAFEARP
jgi:short subunit dehydrogenase-like uncharacterized protein